MSVEIETPSTGTPTTPLVVARHPQEIKLMERHPGRANIVPFSFKETGERPEFGNKATIIIECVDCGAERTIATSDYFQVMRCLDCTRNAKKKTGTGKKAKTLSLSEMVARRSELQRELADLDAKIAKESQVAQELAAAAASATKVEEPVVTEGAAVSSPETTEGEPVLVGAEEEKPAKKGKKKHD